MKCNHCGAPIALLPEAPIDCGFCGVTNAPLPPAPVPVNITHKVVQVLAQPGSADAVEMRCPHCKKRLVTVTAAGVALAGCGTCGGIWIDTEGSRRVVETRDRVFADLAKAAWQHAHGARVRAASPVCPECPAVLDRVRAHGVDLDVCPEHGTWFDAYELITVVEKLRHADFEKKAGGPLATCVACKNNVLAAQTNLTGDGAVCNGCYYASRTAGGTEHRPEAPDVHAAGLEALKALLGTPTKP